MVKVKYCVGSSACEVFPIKCLCTSNEFKGWVGPRYECHEYFLYTTDKEMSLDNESPSSWIHFLLKSVIVWCLLCTWASCILSVQHESFEDAVYNKTVYSTFIKNFMITGYWHTTDTRKWSNIEGTQGLHGICSSMCLAKWLFKPLVCTCNIFSLM